MKLKSVFALLAINVLSKKEQKQDESTTIKNTGRDSNITGQGNIEIKPECKKQKRLEREVLLLRKDLIEALSRLNKKKKLIDELREKYGERSAKESVSNSDNGKLNGFSVLEVFENP